MSQRTEFVLRVFDAGRTETMKELCAAFGVSRKTGYKWLKRFEEGGFSALENMSKRPHTSPLETSAEMAIEVVRLRRERPRWGRKKLHAVLSRRFPNRSDLPSERTIGRILDRAGEPKHRRKTRLRINRPAPNVFVERPNDLWTVDFKGWWRTGDGAKCEPLTVRDAHSRFVFLAELLDRGTAECVRDEFIDLFTKYGLPRAILCDNGSPFGCTSARAGLTRLSAWWVSLGINVVFSRPGHPEDNGAHERMHLDIAIEVEAHAEADRPAQQRGLARWRHNFNHHRPHEAINQQTPAEVYQRSPSRYPKQQLHNYPSNWFTRKVSYPGRVYLHNKGYHLSAGLIGYWVGLEPVDENHVRAWFFDIDLGLLDLRRVTTDRTRRATPGWGSPHLLAAK